MKSHTMTDNNSLLIYTEHFFAASDVTLANESTAIKIIDIALFQTISVSFDTHAIETYQQLGSLCNVKTCLLTLLCLCQVCGARAVRIHVGKLSIFQ